MNHEAIDAVRKLAHLGYRFIVNGENIKAKYEGPGEPDPAQVRPLLDLVSQSKDAVRYFLRSFCPQCGGAFFGTFNGVPRCMACYWEELARLYPDMARMKH